MSGETLSSNIGGSADIFCPSCGTRNLRTNRFCTTCGANLAATSATRVAPTPVARQKIAKPPSKRRGSLVARIIGYPFLILFVLGIIGGGVVTVRSLIEGNSVMGQLSRDL